jgi:hypothetical protein
MLEQEALRKQIASDFPSIDAVNRLYQDDVDLSGADAITPPVAHLTADRMRDALNFGPHLLCLSGHGWENGCCYLNPSVAQNATNGFQQPIVYAMSCTTGNFQHEDAMCEHLLKNANGGAVAYIGYTRYGWIGVGDDFARAFFDRLKTTRHMALLNDSRFSLVNRSKERWTKFVQVLLGDPEMPVWVGKPQPMDVTHPVEITLADQNILVQVETVSGAVIEDAVVCFARGDEIVATNTTDASGHAVLHVDPQAPGDMEVIVTAQDYVPYFGNITIKEQLVCRTAVICTADIICTASIWCHEALHCRSAVMCGTQLVPCRQEIGCNLSISTCLPSVEPSCPAITPIHFKDFVDVIAEAGVGNIKELARKRHTPRVKEVLAKLNPQNRKALSLMLEKINAE